MELKFAGWITYHDSDGKKKHPEIHDLLEIAGKLNLDSEAKKHLWYMTEKIIKEEIIKHKYKFSGEYHQYGECGIPVFELDGELGYDMWSFRSWGGIMADCWNEIEQKSEYDYIDFYMWPDKKESVSAHTELEYYNSNNGKEIEKD